MDISAVEKIKFARDLPAPAPAPAHPDSPADSADPESVAAKVPTGSAFCTHFCDSLLRASQAQMPKLVEWKLCRRGRQIPFHSADHGAIEKRAPGARFWLPDSFAHYCGEVVPPVCGEVLPEGGVVPPGVPAVPLGGFVPPGVVVVLPGVVLGLVLPGVVLLGFELPGAPGVTVFADPGVVLLGVVAPGLVVLGDVASGLLVLGVVLPGVLCVVLGVLCVLPGVVELCGVVVPVVPGEVAVPAGAVVEPGVELCPAVPAPPAGAVPPAELCATTQLPQHKITESNVTFVIDIFLPPKSWSLAHSISFSFALETQYRKLARHMLSSLCRRF